VETRVLWRTPGPQPNGLQAAPDGLWVIDQVDSFVYKLAYEDGAVLFSFPTRAKHASGITLDPFGGIWVSSTFGFEIIRYDHRTGEELAAFPTPENSEAGAHALEWRDGALWVNVPKMAAIYRLDPRDGRIIAKIPAPGDRPHGMAWGDGYLAGSDWEPAASPSTSLPEPDATASAEPGLWCVETNCRAVFLLDPTSGVARREVAIDGPEPHGMTIFDGRFWLCDAGTREVFVLDPA
jgi:streptogramin lyase